MSQTPPATPLTATNQTSDTDPNAPRGEHGDTGPHAGPSASPVGRTPTPVSVVVISKDEPELDQTLTDLHPQCENRHADCVVVDASEGRLDHIRIRHPWVTWIDYTPPLGRTSIPEQRNVGVRAATGDVIAFCDAGGQPGPRWLDHLVDPIVDGTHHVTCGPVRSTRPGVYRIINDQPAGTVVESPPTANLAFSRAAFDAVNGFDERYAYGSDVDFAWRLIRRNTPPISIPDAEMGMDWGPQTLQRKRSWRYGRARARLARFHPDRRLQLLTRQPEITAYPLLSALLIGGGLSALTGSRNGRRSASLAAAAFAALALRNRKTGKPLEILQDHTIYGFAFLHELATAPLGKLNPVIQYPKDPGPYHDHLVPALADVGVHSSYIDNPTPSATLNMLGNPLRAFWLRLRGARIMHIHWVYPWSLTWSRGDSLTARLGARLLRTWYGVWLKAIKLSGMKIVWTVHNVTPHQPVFDDDAKARIQLVRHADAVIAHTEHAKAEVIRRFQARNVTVISQGSTPVPAGDRDKRRNELGANDNDIVAAFVGHITSYKGVDDLLVAASALELDQRRRLILTISGTCREPELAQRISELTEQARSSGLRVELDMRYLTDQELGDHLAGADIAVFPFRDITNSGSVILALTAARGVLIPDLAALDDIPENVAIRYQGSRLQNGEATEQLTRALGSVIDTGSDALAALGARAGAYAKTRTWESTARATRQVYQQTLATPRRRP